MNRSKQPIRLPLTIQLRAWLLPHPLTSARLQPPVHSISPQVTQSSRCRQPGELVCYGTGDFPEVLTCDECLGRNGHEPATSASGYKCVIMQDTQGNFMVTACPGDPAPSTLPDGSPSPVDGIVTAYCQVIGSDGVLGTLTWAACFMYAYFGAGDEYERNKAGLNGTFAV